MKHLIAVSLAALCLTACNNTKPLQVVQSNSTQTAEVTEAVKVAPQKAAGVWIDVRGPEEYAAGHLKDAHNITTDHLAERIATLEPNKNAPVNVYCRTGRRAAQAKELLESLGYTNVTNHGGYADLKAQGYE